jgi:hypothetical protein
MRRQPAPHGQGPADIEVIVCSHGHFDHATGLSGLAGQLGRANMPVLIHPEFWTRRLAIPGREPLELPATSPPRDSDTLSDTSAEEERYGGRSRRCLSRTPTPSRQRPTLLRGVDQVESSCTHEHPHAPRIRPVIGRSVRILTRTACP